MATDITLAQLGIGPRDAVRANRLAAWLARPRNKRRKIRSKGGSMMTKEIEVAELAEKLAMDKFYAPLWALTPHDQTRMLDKARRLIGEPQNNNVRKEK